jgi:hypothetical protein
MKNTGGERHELLDDFDKSIRILIVAELQNNLQGDDTPWCESEGEAHTTAKAFAGLQVFRVGNAEQPIENKELFYVQQLPLHF